MATVLYLRDMPDELLREFRAKCMLRGVSVRQGAEAALRAWVGESLGERLAKSEPVVAGAEGAPSMASESFFKSAVGPGGEMTLSNSGIREFVVEDENDVPAEELRRRAEAPRRR